MWQTAGGPEARGTTPSGTTLELPIASIVRDPVLQVRGKLDAGTIERYAAAYRTGNALPPVAVASVNGALYLTDGWHRLAALQKIGRDTADATVLEAPSLAEAAWLAARANLAHGLPLKPRDRRQVFRVFMRAGRYRRELGRGMKSLREIARELGGTPHTTVRNWMRKDFPRIARQYGEGDEHESQRGGLRSAALFGSPKDTVMAAAEQALAAFAGVTDPEERGEVISRLARVVDEMREAGNWTPPTFADVEF